MKTTFTDAEVKRALGKNEQKAEELLKDKGKIKGILIKARNLLKRLRKLPAIGKIVDDIAETIEMIKDAIGGKYTVPTRIIISALGGIIYIVSPLDIIPDFLPVVGWLDDAAVFMLVLETGLALELRKYREWKKVNDMIDEYKDDADIDDEEGN
jgi:uncharacterized membrane protein YkvA (DUF1232 family)